MLKTPVLILTGENTSPGFKRIVQEQRECMPTAQVLEIPKATHFTLLAASPEATTATLRTFFGR